MSNIKNDKMYSNNTNKYLYRESNYKQYVKSSIINEIFNKENYIYKFNVQYK